MDARSLAARTLPALAVVACADLLGLDVYKTSSPHPADAGVAFTFENQVCDACMHKNCDGPLQQCGSDASCASWETCLTKCDPGGGRCEYDCLHAVPATNAEMGDVAACTFQHCYDACTPGGHWPSQGEGCSQALRANCDTQMRDCASDDVYLDLTRCLFEKNCLVAPPGDTGATASGVIGKSPSCLFRCLDEVRAYEPANAEGGDLLGKKIFDQGLCMTRPGVYEQCREDEDTCVGAFDWPSTTSPVDVKILVTDSLTSELSGAPVPGVHVRACMLSPGGCGDLGGKPTDSNGRLTLTLQQYFGEPLYFELEPGSAADVGKVLYHRSRPPSGNTAFSLGGLWTLQSQAKSYPFVAFGQWSDQRGAIWATMRSCVHRFLLGDRVFLDGEPVGGTPDGSPDGGVHPAVYHGASYADTHSPTPTEKTFGAYIVGVERGQYTLTSQRGDEVVSKAQVWVEENAVSFVDLLPRTTAVGASP